MIAHYIDTHSFATYTLSHIFLLQYRCPFVRIVPLVPAVLPCWRPLIVLDVGARTLHLRLCGCHTGAILVAAFTICAHHTALRQPFTVSRCLIQLAQGCRKATSFVFCNCPPLSNVYSCWVGHMYPWAHLFDFSLLVTWCTLFTCHWSTLIYLHIYAYSERCHFYPRDAVLVLWPCRSWSMLRACPRRPYWESILCPYIVFTSFIFVYFVSVVRVKWSVHWWWNLLVDLTWWRILSVGGHCC